MTALATQPSFYWYDYETFGTHPALDRVAQFGGVRTDLDLNVIGKPLLLYCKPTDDYLPSPAACLVTGITPKQAAERGVPECEFIARIHAEMATPGTCVMGYNNLRFDDEFTRHLLYRNFFDPYAREWQQGNSRWDLLNVVRMTRALRPDGIEWPVLDDGSISNKLEDLTAANGLAHESAHDAVSDVHATIALARLIRTAQPRLYQYLFDNRGKQAAAKLLSLRERNTLAHTSGMFGNAVLNTSLVLPLTQHPINKNEVVVYDLRHDPADLLNLNADGIAKRLFTAGDDLAEDETRIAIKTVRTNKCPVLAPRSVLDSAAADRIEIDPARCEDHRQQLLARIPEVADKLALIYSQREFDSVTDPDRMLYAGGFFSGDDRRKMDALRAKAPTGLASDKMMFDDARIPEMLFRYRARNYPDSLSAAERDEWDAFCAERFYDVDERGESAHAHFLDELARCRTENPDRAPLLDELADYVKHIRPSQ